MTARRRLRVALVTVPVVLVAAIAITAAVVALVRRSDRPTASCAGWAAPESDPDATPAAGDAGGDAAELARLADRCLRLNQIQVVGSHNSYHREPGAELLSALRGFDANLARTLEYSHSPLPIQLAEEGVRQIELDVFADPAGGLFATRHVERALGLPASNVPELRQPGFKVLHVQEVDFDSTCWTFVQCLEQVKGWSDANPRHLPIAILVELKADPIPDPLALGFVTPHPIGRAELDALDTEIRSVFPAPRLITPDDVRGAHATLEAAVRAGGWPTLGAARGKVMFLMDNGDPLRAQYLAGHPSLAGRVLFTSSTPGRPDAAFVKRNDPTGQHAAEIESLVRAGYVVRTRADADTAQARTGDTSQRDAALASGAQWVSTDYPVAGRAARFGTSYVVAIPGPGPARCNPVNSGPRCRDGALEPSPR